MTEPLQRVIEQARATGDYHCARCAYPLADVPLDEDLGVTCPECGYRMRFSVVVRLLPRDPNYDKEKRGGLNRFDRLLTRVGLVVALIAFAIMLVIVAIRGL